MDSYWSAVKKIVSFVEASAVLRHVVAALAVIVATYVAWLVAKKFLAVLEKRIDRNEFQVVDRQAVAIISKFILYALVLVSGTTLIREFEIQGMENAFHAVLLVLLSMPLKELVLWILAYLERTVASKTETKVDDIIFELLQKFAGVIIWATAVILALDILGINVMPFIAGAGVAGIAIGFAAKDTLSNLIAGVLLIIDRPFEIGDRIEVWSAPSGSATWGDVVDIGIRATRIKTTDNIVIIIPNNEIMKRDIVNYSVLSNRIRVRVNIGVAYDTDIDRARKVIVGIAEKAEWILKDPAPKVVVRNFGESSVDLQLRVWINDARKRMDTISFITDHVKEAFDREGIEIPYPKRDITITQVVAAKSQENFVQAGQAIK